MRSTAVAVFSVLMLAIGSASFANDTPVSITYDHQAINNGATLPVVLKPGQPFSVSITNTCEKQFTYSMHGLKTVPRAGAGAPPPPSSKLTTKVLSSTYDSQYGSYLVAIEKNGVPDCVDDAGKAVSLNAVDVVIAVTPLEWEVGQDAALSLIPWTSKKWTTQATTVVTTPASGNTPAVTAQKFKVLRDADGEDVARASFATLTHFYAPSRNNGLALGFGLIDNNAEYYVGWSWGLGVRNSRVVNIAGGVAYTPTSVLPVGVQEGDVLDNAAALGTPRSVHRLRPFVAFTATFFRTNDNSAGKPQAPADK